MYLTLHGVAADPPLLAGADVRGKAEAGGVALGHRIGVGCFGIVADQKAMGSAVGALISAKCWAHSSMPWVSISVAMVAPRLIS